jgi:thiosulfate/3-mercaptopyruvate sulfurtransferase
MTNETVVDPKTLSEHPEWVVFDCRFDLANPSAGRAEYEQGHVPGALYAHLDEDLSGPIGAGTGRHPLPDPSHFAERLGRWGIEAGRQVLVYDDLSGAYAVRLWWMLRWLGHREVAMLDGGWRRWCREGYPVSRHVPKPLPVSFHSQPQDDLVVDSAELHSALGTSRYGLVDLRAAERYRGENEPIDPVAGHVPGAVNLPHVELLDAEGNLLSEGELAAKLKDVLGVVHAQNVVLMCGSGVTACLGILAARAAGLEEPKLYAGSWSEWIRDPRRPVALGDRA